MPECFGINARKGLFPLIQTLTLGNSPDKRHIPLSIQAEEWRDGNTQLLLGSATQVERSPRPPEGSTVTGFL